MPLPNRRVIQEWFDFGQNDFECGKFLVEQERFLEQAMERFQQAAEKYLKGFLMSRGWHLEKTHAVRVLVDEAVKYDNRFGRFAEVARTLSQRYVEQRYPGMPAREVSLDEAQRCRAEVADLIALIRSLTP